LNDQETQEPVFELRTPSPRDVLTHFLNGNPENSGTIESVLQKIDGVAHIGIEVDDIDKTISELRMTYPERGYRLIKRFQSVGIPRNYDGSTCVIAQIQPDDHSFPFLELFSIDWQGKFKEIPPQQRRRLIEHVALNAVSPRDVQEIIDTLSDGKTIVPPQVNQDAGEIFGYLTNGDGEKIEIVHHLQPEEASPSALRRR